jgi:hypothetical protein
MTGNSIQQPNKQEQHNCSLFSHDDEINVDANGTITSTGTLG